MDSERSQSLSCFSISLIQPARVRSTQFSTAYLKKTSPKTSHSHLIATICSQYHSWTHGYSFHLFLSVTFLDCLKVIIFDNSTLNFGHHSYFSNFESTTSSLCAFAKLGKPHLLSMVAILFAFTYWVYYIFYGEKNKKVGKEQKNKTYQLPPPENYFLTYYNP